MSLPKPEQFEEFYRATTLAISELEVAERWKKEPGYLPKKPPKPKASLHAVLCAKTARELKATLGDDVVGRRGNNRR